METSDMANEKLKDYRLVILRHGESEWNKENLFTGWPMTIPHSIVLFFLGIAAGIIVFLAGGP
jgi:hypothetical protein